MGTQEDEEYEKDEAAIQIVRDLLANKELWLELEAAALTLQDALDDMNDSIRNVEEAFRLHRYRPGWVPLDDQAALIWTGNQLVYDSGKSTTPLLTTNKKWRIRSMAFMVPLWEELSRKRLIGEEPARTSAENPEPQN